MKNKRKWDHKKGTVDRRGFLRATATLAAGARFSGIFSTAKASNSRPNIILITADDLGWRELGCYGNKDIKTPNLDELAGGGVRFINAFVTASSCSASRSSIITGQASHSVGVHGLTNIRREYQMSSEVPTLARCLRDSGFRTGIQGKWHVATFKPTRNYGYQKRMSLLRINNSMMARWFISANKDRPFHLELNFIQTHRQRDGTFKMDPDFPVNPDSIHVPSYWCIPDWPDIREDVAKYYSQAARMDHIIGEIMDHLDAEGLTDRTLIVFLSDNGPPYPGCKVTCYDRGIGTPFIMRWPEGLPRGRVIDDPVSAIDIMPTCLDATAVPVPDSVQGVSLLPSARGEVTEVHDAVFAEITYHGHYIPMRAMRTREWKYIENFSPDPTGLDQNNFDWAKRVAKLPEQRCCVDRPKEELFNLVRDPDERVNLAQDPNYADVKSKLRKKLHRWRKATHDPFPDVN